MCRFYGSGIQTVYFCSLMSEVSGTGFEGWELEVSEGKFTHRSGPLIQYYRCASKKTAMWRHTYREDAHEDGGRNWSNAFTSQVTLRMQLPPEARRLGEDSPSWPPMEPTLLMPGFQTFGIQNYERINFHCYEPSSLWYSTVLKT